jgi:hypothetical protein
MSSGLDRFTTLAHLIKVFFIGYLITFIAPVCHLPIWDPLSMRRTVRDSIRRECPGAA